MHIIWCASEWNTLDMYFSEIIITINCNMKRKNPPNFEIEKKNAFYNTTISPTLLFGEGKNREVTCMRQRMKS